MSFQKIQYTAKRYFGVLPSFIEPNPADDGIGPYASFGEVHVLEIGKDGGVSISMKLQGRSEDTGILRREEGDSDSRKDCTRLLRDLRSPPDNSTARIVVWSIPRADSLRSGLVAAFGFGLKIQPAIFATMLSIVQEDSSNSMCRRLEPDYVMIGNSIATVARNYVPNKRVPPVLFVAKVHHKTTDFLRRSPVLANDYMDMVRDALMSEIYGRISFYRPASDMRSLRALAPQSSEHLDRLSDHVYLNVLSKYVQNGEDVDAQRDGPLLNAILPLLHLEVLALRPQYEMVRTALLRAHRCSTGHYDNLKQLSYDTLDRQRFGLRRKLEDLKESRSRFVKFSRLQNAPKWLEKQPWLSQEEEIIEAVSEARAVEAEARDYMQLQTGNLSIEESRKSIQLSNQQMSEAKRGMRIDSPVVRCLADQFTVKICENDWTLRHHFY